MSEYKYQVALSFSGNDREIVDEFANLLLSKGVKIFYDKFEQADLWGKDLFQHLQTVYRDSAEYCIVFISESYLSRSWTKHELKQAQERAFMENKEYILPLKVDATEVPGLNSTTGYISLSEHSLESIADLVLKKLYGSEYDDFFSGPPENWNNEMVEFEGRTMASFWPDKIEKAQKYAAYNATVVLERSRFGDEESDNGFTFCPDCGVKKQELHVPGCDWERCPLCRGQAISCDCDLTCTNN